MKEPLLYRVVRPIITILFYVVFHPNIIGKENIPKHGKIILAGNHTNFLDCLLLISSTKRTVHFLAKHELIKCPFGFVFKNMGIIPVDRKAKHNNGAFNEAINCLSNEMVIGIFPESTINRTKTEITIPFKSGAVKMAFQSDSEIIPFSITGKYNVFGKGVTLVFGKPYSIKSNDYKKETDKLREKINTMIIERR